MGKSTISMAIFNSYVTNYQRVVGNFPTFPTGTFLGLGDKTPEIPTLKRSPAASVHLTTHDDDDDE